MITTMDNNKMDAEIESHLNCILALQWKLSRYYLDPDVNKYNINKTKAKIQSYKNKIIYRINILKNNYSNID